MLDTGASLSAVHCNLIQHNDREIQKTQLWTPSPNQLANEATCDPIGIIWLTNASQGQRIYHRFVVVPQLSRPFVLGMDFIMLASISIHLPSRIVKMNRDPPIAEQSSDKFELVDFDRE